MKTIEVTVAPDGSTQVETRGFAGSSCRQASEFLKAALGSTRAERTTAEFFQAELSEQQQARQQR